MAQSLGTTSRGSVLKHIQALEEKGYIERESHKARTYRILQSPHASQNDNTLPLVGQIAAGKPIVAFENIEHIDLNSLLNPGHNCFLLQVKGDSMIGIGIMEDDYVLIEPSQVARNGQVVVAIVDGYDATLKRYRHNGNGTISLIPENVNMEPMIYPEERVMIQGVMIGQVRRY